MELITGRSPVDYSRAPGEVISMFTLFNIFKGILRFAGLTAFKPQVNLVDWFKGMVGSKRGEDVVDQQIEFQPPPRALKRVLLVCLRCIDSDAYKRPKMGQIAHMLEGDDFPFRAVSSYPFHLFLI